MIFWDPSREAFTLPWVHIPVTWYGILFATGFFCGYWIAVFLLKERYGKKAFQIVDRLALYVLLGAVAGARLGHVFFYENWSDFTNDPLEIFRIWKGGLASHGAVVGIIVAAYIFYRSSKKELGVVSFFTVLDWLVIPAAAAAVFIRVGNFINQEILGTPTHLPWGVVFGHPADGLTGVPRHPAQLYEAVFYLLFFCVLWKTRALFKTPGKRTGLFLMVVFLFRFVIEWTKVEQSPLLMHGFLLTMGQLLSIPLILLGLFLFFKKGSR